jgi:hydrogenase maturation protease
VPLVILGLGNLLLTDDGVGVHAARALAADPPPGAEVREVGTAVFEAWSVVDRASTIVAIDAVDAGEAPGTLVRFDLDHDEPVGPPASLHDLDLPALVRSLPPARRPRVVVIGVQPAVVAPGLDLSPIVAAALPALVHVVRVAVADEARNRRGARDCGCRHPGNCRRAEEGEKARADVVERAAKTTHRELVEDQRPRKPNHRPGANVQHGDGDAQHTPFPCP